MPTLRRLPRCELGLSRPSRTAHWVTTGLPCRLSDLARCVRLTGGGNEDRMAAQRDYRTVGLVLAAVPVEDVLVSAMRADGVGVGLLPSSHGAVKSAPARIGSVSQSRALPLAVLRRTHGVTSGPPFSLNHTGSSHPLGVTACSKRSVPRSSGPPSLRSGLPHSGRFRCPHRVRPKATDAVKDAHVGSVAALRLDQPLHV